MTSITSMDYTKGTMWHVMICQNHCLLHASSKDLALRINQSSLEPFFYDKETLQGKATSCTHPCQVNPGYPVRRNCVSGNPKTQTRDIMGGQAIELPSVGLKF